MKKIFHVYTESDGEMDWFFDEDGNVLQYWYNNDACWREEYMNPLLASLGIEVVEGGGPKFNKILKKTLKGD